ncbi:UPF0688 protein C1orf174-like [Salvelinus fontinalis]|uniref:UPF0688 protein C1orf174-like n=1 Tax=Salvelinus fontinalis TaxID=8038 RepID=UPI0024868034|nr:UPF0688 protein C1orf174-like [Salvelinus fontinalis]XP_055787703.1 UPF0688 protein C1orf174-like [Salvelinus fontinalis]XP_055787704.1 UPF0688 protein C1orf174-like [Salvelinus fontinalis]
MRSRVSNLKRRKGMCTVASSGFHLEVKSSDKSSGKRRRVKKMKIEDSKTEMPLNDWMVGGCRESTTISERLSCDGCERPEKTSCGAPPDLEELWEGKENGVRLELNYCRTNGLPEKMAEDGVVIDKSVFLDDDSNQVLPVEKFFGNMEVVQDCPRRSTATSTFSRREHRRRHRRQQYYAKDDSDEVGYTEMHQDEIVGT